MRFIYGTAWKEQETTRLCRQAIGSGFRAIDTANQRRHYFEAGVGEAIAAEIEAGRITRADLFLQTKFTHRAGHDHRLPYAEKAPIAAQVEESFASSLAHLGVEYVDSYLLHGPSTRGALASADFEAWRAMERLARSGHTRTIGVSNVSLAQLEELLAGAKRLKPAIVQNRCFATSGWDREIRALCRANDIAYQGFSLLTANTQVATATVVERAAARVAKTPAQVIFRFAVQAGIVPLTGTTSQAHMDSDLDIEDFSLTTAEMRAIEKVAG